MLCLALSYCAKPAEVRVEFIFIQFGKLHSLSQVMSEPCQLHLRHPAIDWITVTACCALLETAVGTFASGMSALLTIQGLSGLSQELSIPVLTCVQKRSTNIKFPMWHPLNVHRRHSSLDALCSHGHIYQLGFLFAVAENPVQIT